MLLQSPWVLNGSVNAPVTYQLTTHSSTCLYLLPNFQKSLCFPLFINPSFRYYSNTKDHTTPLTKPAFSVLFSEFIEMRGMKSLTIWALFAALLSQQLFASVTSIRFEDEKTYYTPPSGKKKSTHIVPFFYVTRNLDFSIFI